MGSTISQRSPSRRNLLLFETVRLYVLHANYCVPRGRWMEISYGNQLTFTRPHTAQKRESTNTSAISLNFLFIFFCLSGHFFLFHFIFLLVAIRHASCLLHPCMRSISYALRSQQLFRLFCRSYLFTELFMHCILLCYVFLSPSLSHALRVPYGWIIQSRSQVTPCPSGRHMIKTIPPPPPFPINGWRWSHTFFFLLLFLKLKD